MKKNEIYNGWTKNDILLELENISDDFKCEDMMKDSNAIREVMDAIREDNETDNIFSVLGECINNADSKQLYGIGDTLLEIIIAIKISNGIEIE